MLWVYIKDSVEEGRHGSLTNSQHWMDNGYCYHQVVGCHILAPCLSKSKSIWRGYKCKNEDVGYSRSREWQIRQADQGE